MIPGRAGFSALEWSLVALVIVGLMAWVISVRGLAHGRGVDTQCSSNARQLQMAMVMYAADFGGFMPRDCGQLNALNSYTGNIHIFRCPAAGRQESGAWRGDYLLRLRAAGDDAPDEFWVIDDRPDRHSFGTWVGARADGSVVMQPAAAYPQKAGQWGKPEPLRMPGRLQLPMPGDRTR